MFTSKDISFKTIFVINCLDNKGLRVSNGELLLEDTKEKKTLTKMPFQKILALFVIGHITITTPLLDKCTRHNVAVIVMKPNLRPIFFWHNSTEANYLVRQRQHHIDYDDISIARMLVYNKIKNQHKLLSNTRLKSELIESAKKTCTDTLLRLPNILKYKDLMGLEGIVSKSYFKAYFDCVGWECRMPRTKIDAINSTMDIGYTILFNYIETNVRMFGFDVYIGVYHKLWFKRKSLICDLIEPFRCIIDSQIRKSFNKNEFKESDFQIRKNEYILKREYAPKYYKIFFSAIISRKMDIFRYTQDYYRCFMGRKSVPQYPRFNY